MKIAHPTPQNLSSSKDCRTSPKSAVDLTEVGMAPSAISQRRTHNLLLFQKLLSLRDGASPFTLLLDTLEQSAQPVVREFMVRAKVSKRTCFLLF
jgi:hypothetical protein